MLQDDARPKKPGWQRDRVACEDGLVPVERVDGRMGSCTVWMYVYTFDILGSKRNCLFWLDIGSYFV